MTTEELQRYVLYVRKLERVATAAHDCVEDFNPVTYSMPKRELEWLQDSGFQPISHDEMVR